MTPIALQLLSLHRYPSFFTDLVAAKLWFKCLGMFHSFYIGKSAMVRGLPIISIARNSSIRIGDRAYLVSRSRNTALGVNHPVIIRTLRTGAAICIGSHFRGSGIVLCAASGITNVSFYTTNDLPLPSRTRLVYNWAGEQNVNNEQAALPNNLALLDSYINTAADTWYLSVTNLDAVFTNGYSLYFYYFAGIVGRGGQNYVRCYAGPTTNTPGLGTKQWNLFTTTTNNDGHFTRAVTSTTGVSGETLGANYFVLTNLSGGAFDLLITNGYYGGINALEIVANPFPTLSVLRAATNRLSGGLALTLTNTVTPAPSDGENVRSLTERTGSSNPKCFTACRSSDCPRPTVTQ